MNLTDIQSPSDIKGMSISELEDLAAEIRRFLVENIAKTGGHLASNLGVVELTIAAHYVFNSPQDKLFFDVGHQCYTHKILTGRASEFSTLRQYGGLSGFEKRSESEHDVWEGGHSSTSLSAALGMAIARDLKHEDYQVVPVIGDGALGSGMAFEALNQIGYEKRKMVIIFNDNNMSISRNVGAMTYNFARLRSSRGYNNFKDNLKENLNRNEFGRNLYTGLKSVKDSIRDSIVDKGIFGEFNLDYLGPIDGHNIKDLIQAFRTAAKHDGPIVVHVITTKGKGYAPCEHDRTGFWHGVGPFNPETGKPLHEIPAGYEEWARLFSDTVADMAEDNPNIVAITPAMVHGSALENFFARYPERSFDCGIAEEHAASFAAGLAISGMRPYLAIYSSFMQRAYDQINHDICRMDLPVVIGIDHAGIVGGDGETHQGVFDIGFLKPIPNLILAQPKDAEEAVRLLQTAFAQNHPMAIRYPKGTVKVPSAMRTENIPIGSWEILPSTDHDQLYVFTYGPNVVNISDKLKANAIPASVVNCRFLKPMDEEVLQAIGESGKPCIVYETDMKEGGIGEDISAWFSDRHMNVSLTRMGIGDYYVQQGAETRLRKAMHIDMETLLETILKQL